MKNRWVIVSSASCWTTSCWGQETETWIICDFIEWRLSYPFIILHLLNVFFVVQFGLAFHYDQVAVKFISPQLSHFVGMPLACNWRQHNTQSQGVGQWDQLGRASSCFLRLSCVMPFSSSTAYLVLNNILKGSQRKGWLRSALTSPVYGIQCSASWRKMIK